MQVDNGVHEEKLWSASLNGHQCQAFAWVQATSIDVLDGRGGVRRVPGVRRWRGKALIDRDALPSDVSSNRAVHYSGKVLDGDRERTISADVFLLFTQAGLNGNGASNGHSKMYVEFIGAETPFKAHG